MDDELPGDAGGTWPRAIKRSNSSQRSLSDCVSLWEVSRELAREKQDLAVQLRQATEGAAESPTLDLASDTKLAADLQKLVDQAGQEKLMRSRVNSDGMTVTLASHSLAHGRADGTATKQQRSRSAIARQAPLLSLAESAFASAAPTISLTASTGIRAAIASVSASAPPPASPLATDLSQPAFTC